MAKRLGEFELIARLAAQVAPPPPGVVSIGDDCAAWPQGDGFLLLTNDAAVEGRHFVLGVTPPRSAGLKLAAANASDIAACGGQPQAMLVSVGLPEGLAPEWLEAFYQGLGEGAARYGFALVGGNVTGANQLWLDAFLTGYTPRFVARSGARPGHRLLVSGPLGDAAAGLKILLGQRGAPLSAAESQLAQACLEPLARTDLAPLLARRASAAIDISDGLSSELNHLAQASGVTLRVEAGRLPISPALAAWAQNQPLLPFALPFMLHGGEGYQLLFTCPPEAEAEFLAQGCVTIGQASPAPADATYQVLLDGQPLAPGGWDHLKPHP